MELADIKTLGTTQNAQPRVRLGVEVLRGKPGGDLLSRDIPRTIIGAAPFHGPVRDGKAWFQQAVVVRH